MRTPLLLALVLLAGWLPRAAEGQPLDDVMAAVRNGGGWVSVPIVAGSGSEQTMTLPTMGITLSGCLRVWDGHSGRWEIRARDTLAGSTLSVAATPGKGVPFSHTFGLRSQIAVDFRWSEPRDTTLWLWVGVDGLDQSQDVCTPKS